jgi:hypothetical protein
MNETHKALAVTRGMTALRWVGFVVGCYFLGSVFVGIGVVVGLLLRWPTSWDALVWALPLLWAASVVLSGLIMGTLLHVRGTRQWLVALTVMVVVCAIPVVVPPVARFIQAA